jgi:acyl-CoA thioester hydrolase
MTPIFRHTLEVRFRDCDPMGHANNAAYLTYLEQARFKCWQSLWGLSVSEWPGETPGVILARAEIDYKIPARFGDLLEVRIGLAGIGRTSFSLDYEIADRQQRIVATARTVQVMFDYQTSQPVPVPAAIREQFEGR